MKDFSEYLKTIAEINNLNADKPVEWVFYPGMLFLSRDKWWGDFCFRATEHEGIDICFFRTHNCEILSFNHEIKVPAIEDGRIINICNDFLGQTIVVERQTMKFPYTRVLITYAHIRPAADIRINDIIKEKHIIANICDTSKNPKLSPHLHLSCFEVPITMQANKLDWSFFSGSIHAYAINPVFLP